MPIYVRWSVIEKKMGRIGIKNYEKLAEQTGISSGNLWKLRNNKHEPSLKALSSICKALNLKPAEILVYFDTIDDFIDFETGEDTAAERRELEIMQSLEEDDWYKKHYGKTEEELRASFTTWPQFTGTGQPFNPEALLDYVGTIGDRLEEWVQSTRYETDKLKVVVNSLMENPETRKAIRAAMEKRLFTDSIEPLKADKGTT